jgi:hypothetical protein
MPTGFYSTEAERLLNGDPGHLLAGDVAHEPLSAAPQVAHRESDDS